MMMIILYLQSFCLFSTLFQLKKKKSVGHNILIPSIHTEDLRELKLSSKIMTTRLKVQFS